MRLLVLTLAVYLAAVIDTSAYGLFEVRRVAPDLVAMVAAVWLLSGRGQWDFLVVGGVGLLADLIAPGRVGAGMAFYMLSGAVLVRLRGRHTDNLPAGVLLVGGFVAVTSLGVATVQREIGLVEGPWSTLALHCGAVAVYTAGVSVPVLMVTRWCHGSNCKGLGAGGWGLGTGD